MNKNRNYLESLNFRQLRKLHSPSTKEEYMQLQAKAKEGPLFSAKTLGLMCGYNLPKPLTKWMGSYIERNSTYPLFAAAAPLVIDWVNAVPEAAKQIETMATGRQLVDAAQDWHEITFKVHKTGHYLTNDVVAELADGYKIVQISNEEDLTTEGNLMGHCVGQYWLHVRDGYSKIYSLRDSSNHPHVTIEVGQSSKQRYTLTGLTPPDTKCTVKQCYGKQNQRPIPKYHPYLIDWFTRMEYWSGFVVGKLPLPEDKYVQVINDPYYQMWVPTLLQGCTYPSVLTELVNSTDVNTLFYVASNPHTPVQVLSRLAQKQESLAVRTSRYHTFHWGDYSWNQFPWLNVLANSEHTTVKAHVAANIRTDHHTLTELAKDPDAEVRLAVAGNEKFHEFKLLAKDTCPLVRNKVRERVLNGHIVKAPITYQLKKYESNFIACASAEYYDYREPFVPVIKKKTWEKPKLVRC